MKSKVTKEKAEIMNNKLPKAKNVPPPPPPPIKTVEDVAVKEAVQEIEKITQKLKLWQEILYNYQELCEHKDKEYTGKIHEDSVYTCTRCKKRLYE